MHSFYLTYNPCVYLCAQPECWTLHMYAAVCSVHICLSSFACQVFKGDTSIWIFLLYVVTDLYDTRF